MSKFEYTGSWPKEARSAVEAALKGLDWLVPDWCTDIMLRWVCPDDDLTASASTTTNYQYRWARIDCHPALLSSPPEERRRDMMHELLHVFIAPTVDYAEEVFARLLEDAPQFLETVRAGIGAHHESAVQDLAIVLHRRMETSARQRERSRT